MKIDLNELKEIVLYKEYGAFYIPNEWAYKYINDNNLLDEDVEDGYDLEYYFKEKNINIRENKEFINYIRNYPGFKIITIPKNSYYLIDDYDGYEFIFYSDSPIYTDNEILKGD